MTGINPTKLKRAHKQAERQIRAIERQIKQGDAITREGVKLARVAVKALGNIERSVKATEDKTKRARKALEKATSRVADRGLAQSAKARAKRDRALDILSARFGK